jgi:hypothetical protein
LLQPWIWLLQKQDGLRTIKSAKTEIEWIGNSLWDYFVVNETHSSGIEQKAGSEKLLRYEDFLKPNPFVRPWMKPYLPSNQRLSDAVAMCIGSALCLGVLAGLHELGVSDLVASTIGGAGIFAFQFDFLNRNTLAGMDYRRAKRNANNKISN